MERPRGTTYYHIITLAFVLKVPKIQRPQALKITVFNHHTIIWRLSREPADPRTPYISKTKHFAADSISLPVFKFVQLALRNTWDGTKCITATKDHPRSLILWVIKSTLCYFLLLINSKIALFRRYTLCCIKKPLWLLIIPSPNIHDFRNSFTDTIQEICNKTVIPPHTLNVSLQYLVKYKC